MNEEKKEILDLLELGKRLKCATEDYFPEKIWLRAEISSISVRPNGHCYLELSQSERGTVVAKVRAVIWRSRYPLVSKAFESDTGSPLAAGMTILCRAEVSYSELYGLSLTIDDIDSEVSLGNAEKLRLETIKRLEDEGLMNLQKSLTLSSLPYRLAVISARDAAGYGDFRRHLEENDYGFRFKVDLFEALMQGSDAPASIVDALDAVESSKDKYDAVLIMRGGGSVLDLGCFDDYGLCFSIARFPVPVFTAIGHDRDYHVADMVAYRFTKTPTALADEMIDCYIAEDSHLTSYLNRLRLAFLGKLSLMESKVSALEGRIFAADPRNILLRGYALVTDSAGKVIKSVGPVSEDDRLTLMFADGKLELKVEKKYGI